MIDASVFIIFYCFENLQQYTTGKCKPFFKVYKENTVKIYTSKESDVPAYDGSEGPMV
jgi:hypothetical protein